MNLALIQAPAPSRGTVAVMTRVIFQLAVNAMMYAAMMVTRVWMIKPSWSPTAPLMYRVSVDSRAAIAPLEFSSLSNQPISCGYVTLISEYRCCS